MCIQCRHCNNADRLCTVLYAVLACFVLLQPLFIQTPLQVMLETLVEKLQLQATVITGMQDRVSLLRGSMRQTAYDNASEKETS